MTHRNSFVKIRCVFELVICFILCQDICGSIKEKKYNFGESQQITCDLAADPTDIIWFYNGVKLQSGSKIIISRKTLHIYCLEPSDNGIYKCESSTQSAEYQLTVLNPANETYFLMYGKDSKKCLIASGTKLVLDSCNVQDCHRKWRWNTKHQLTPGNNLNKCLSVLKLKAGEKVVLEECNLPLYNEWECRDEGLLSVNGTDFYFSENNFDDFVLLTSAQKPNLWLNYITRKNVCSKSTQEPTVIVDPDHVVLTERDTATITCKAFNFHNPTFTWLKNGQNITGQSDLNLHVDVPNRLIIPFAYPVNIGVYVCVVKDLTSTANATTQIEVFKDPSVVQLNLTQTANTGDDVHLSCQIYATKNPNSTVWYKDGVIISPKSHRYNITVTNKALFSKFWSHLYITSVTFNDRGTYECGINLLKLAKGELLIHVKPEVQITKDDDQLICSVSGFPPPRVTWYKDNRLVENSKSQTRNITITQDTVNYTCLASNVMGTSRDSYISIIPVPKETKRSVGIVVGIVVAAILLVLFLVVVVCWCWKKRKITYNNNIEENNYTTVRYTSTRGLLSEERAPRTQIQFHPRTDIDPGQQKGFSLKARVYNSMKPRSRAEWEIPADCIKFDRKIGEGQFGQVWKGQTLSRKGEKTVAIKMLKENAETRERKSLFDELEFMKTMTPHPNIVALVGCCTRSERLLVVVEYIPNGNLKDFLLQSRGNSKEIYTNLAPYSKSLASRDLVSFAYQIARGMSYLERVKRVHRDLAARNILIGDNQTCKIGDFGLARDIYCENYYRKTSGGRLPLRWMAYESIFNGITTSQSDAWSFGVLLWEIVTLGGNPYPAMTRDQLIEGLQRGYRMPKPHHCSDEIYSIMGECWQQNPDKRPTFAELTVSFLRLISLEQIYINMEKFGDNDYVTCGSYEMTEDY